jgi:hypothetical protein
VRRSIVAAAPIAPVMMNDQRHEATSISHATNGAPSAKPRRAGRDRADCGPALGIGCPGAHAAVGDRRERGDNNAYAGMRSVDEDYRLKDIRLIDVVDKHPDRVRHQVVTSCRVPSEHR